MKPEKKSTNIKPGDRRNISFPQDIDPVFLDFLNDQNNVSGTLLRLARDAWFLGDIANRIQELEKRILRMENCEGKKEIEIDYMDILKSADIPSVEPVDDEF